MRIAYVCRDLAVDDLIGAGAGFFAVAEVMARAGHQVFLVCEALAGPWERAVRAGGGGLAWVPVAAGAADHQYFTERHGYADRVYRTLAELEREGGLDVVEIAAVEAVTTIRAKRLLGEFASTVLAVRAGVDGGVDGVNSVDVANFDDAIAAFMAGYAVEHADVVVEESTAFVGAVNRTKGNTYAVWYFGDIRPESGIDTFLRAAELVVRRGAGFRFVVAGRDTDSDPFGRSFYEYVTRRLSAEVREVSTFVGPPREGFLPPVGAQCVVGQGAGSGRALRLARALDQVVVMAGRDPEELAAVLVSNAASASAPASPVTVGENRANAASIAAGYRVHGTSQRGSQLDEADLVSVVIPLWNQGDYLADAIESVRACGYPNVEIVVVDDGSTDPATIAAFEALRNVVKVRQPNAGLSAARNAGIAACSGRYVIPLDADDLLPAGFVSAAVRALRGDPELAYVTGYVRHFGLLDHTYVPVGHVPGLSLVLNTHARATGLFRKTALEAVGGYDPELPACEDWDLYLSMAAAGFRSDVLPMVGQRYRRHPDSMTFSSSNAMRLPLLQYLLRKHAPKASADDALSLPLILAHLWKSHYEPSASVRLQQEQLQAPTARSL